jgi:hypothetical protein
MKRKLLTTILGTVVLVTILSFAFGQSVIVKGAKMPPGIDPRRWKPLWEEFGIVFDYEGGRAKGQFLIRVDGVWRPFYVAPGPAEFHRVQ